MFGSILSACRFLVGSDSPAMRRRRGRFDISITILPCSSGRATGLLRVVTPCSSQETSTMEPIPRAITRQIRIGDSGCATDEESLPLSFRRRGHRRKHVVVPGHYNITVRVNSLDRQNGDCPNSLCFPFTKTQVICRLPEDELASRYLTSRILQPLHAELETAAYHFTVYPQVSAIEPSVGSLFGGNNLTLH
ncbi:hypothetical protein AK812_SmicGene43147, partial [Symbiodinium microadriaticum]